MHADPKSLAAFGPGDAQRYASIMVKIRKQKRIIFYLKATWIFRPTAAANFSSVDSLISVA